MTFYLGPPDTFIGSLQKAVFEQVTMEPFVMLLYYSYDAVLSRQSWAEFVLRLRGSFGSIFIRNSVFWLPANFLNYYIGTPDLRVIFANTCSFFWNTYFSTFVNRKKTAEAH
eukprot:CAMPEP_0184734744 /NCGR_PEP_ID=MMETSP0314-20130426/61443_1 /TAXON_ID=38298 /ORGANISM="Rhodella maculata, Strain CCMP 736" /LENGTH=111 /DNA_ID=CAMNT_0027201747 /DNA_START=266 /DNA_END=601 /DNA_ORIENTATION=+